MRGSGHVGNCSPPCCGCSSLALPAGIAAGPAVPFVRPIPCKSTRYLYYLGSTTAIPEKMAASKLSISLAPEVDQALDVLAARSGQAKSALIEVALRENPLVSKYIQIVRAEMHAEPAAVPRREIREKPKGRRTAQRVSP